MQIVQRYDVIMIQEIRDKDEIAVADLVINVNNNR